MTLPIKAIAPIFLTMIFTGAILYAAQLSRKLNFGVSDNDYLNGQFSYQILLLLVTLVSILTTYLLNKQSFANYFSLGQISAVGEELSIFGIKQGDSWLKTGLSLCIFISIVTAAFLYFQLKQVTPNWAVLQSGIFWILLFSLTNSFGEEMIYRLGIVAPLKGLVAPSTIFFISAILFGVPHFAGMPNGVLGASLAGLLGFVLAKSMYETNGFFWAWTIHFIQDILIFCTLYLINVSASK